MLIKKFVVGPLQTNCYIFGDPDSREVVLIDPGADSYMITKFIKQNNLSPKYIINTHGHGDHIAANGDFDAPILIHELDADHLGDANLNMSGVFGVKITSPAAKRILKDGDRIRIGGLSLEVIHSPGHTPGGICLNYKNELLFSGDTLFFEGVGRTDLPNASWESLLDSIKNKIMKLPDDCKVYPGHGPETTIGHERKHNPFL